MKLNMYADFTLKVPFEERLIMIKQNGFDGVMLGFSEELMYTQYEKVRKFGLEIENVHSPFDRMNALWQIVPESDYILQRTLDCIEICGKNQVPTVIIHPTDGLVPPRMGRFGLDNFERIVTKAENCGVNIAFENIQLPQFLDLLFDNFGSSENVKFCYDIGHENCFSKGSDCLSKFGDRLCALHIHDNKGNSDDHLIPYDGNIDYDVFLPKLKQTGADVPLSLEVFYDKSERYRRITHDEFVARTARAGRFLLAKYNCLDKESL